MPEAAPLETPRVVLPTPAQLPLLRAIELAAAQSFSLIDLPPARRLDSVPLDRLELARLEGLLWIAVNSTEAPIGFALAGVLADQVHLEELAVHPEHQRKGVGSALVNSVIAEARTRGCGGVTLTTYRFVEWNAPWYARRGFRELRVEERSAELHAVVEREVSLGLARERRLVMRLPLT
jgi:GNAT superfamily N-acetyltransferase